MNDFLHLLSREPVQIASLEDDPAIQRLLPRVFGPAYVLSFARNGGHLESLVGLGLVHLVLLDLMLPGESGMDIGRRLRARSNVPILIVSGQVAQERIVEGLDAFADDYVTKPFVADVLRSRVTSVLRRCRGRPESTNAGMVIDFGGARVDGDTRKLTARGQAAVYLTEREYQLLVRLCRAPGQPVTRDELSLALCGRDWDPSDRSLDVHVCNLRVKIDRVMPGRRLIRAARGVGYFLNGTVRLLDARDSEAAAAASP